MTEFYYIKSISETPRKEGIILDPKGKIKRFASEQSAERWLNKNKEDLTPELIYTPTKGIAL